MMPRWQREIRSFMGIKRGLLLEGNIHDEYPVYETNGEETELLAFDSLDQVFLSLNGESAEMIFCDPLDGFYCYDDTEEGERQRIESDLEGYTYRTEIMDHAGNLYFQPTGKKGCRSDQSAEAQRLVWISEIIRRAMTGSVHREDPDAERQRIFVLNLASRMERCNLRPSDANTMFMNLQMAMQNSYKVNGNYNMLILIADKASDIPAWFYQKNPDIRTIALEAPDRSERRQYLSSLVGELEKFRVLGDEDNEEGVRFVSSSEGLLCREMSQILDLALHEEIPPSDIQKAFQLYKYGVPDNPWDNLEKDIVRRTHDLLTRRVKGQDEALRKVENVIKRAVNGLSGLQHSSSGCKPRGILFFAGPTGVGKTEAAKAAAEAVFGDERACIRFDMSEYRLEQSDQKLLGAPPGYVGYEGGGQLTNAVRNHPFSVLLFDEIEKASPTILDKFLQIMEDGRMTDNQGNTVDFRDTLIIFTSNIGLTKPVYDAYGREMNDANGNPIRKPVIEIEDPEVPDTPEFRANVSETLTQGVKDYFINIGRPELLNRLGENNIVVFSFIDKPAAEAICVSKMESICTNIQKQKGIRVHCEEIMDHMKKLAVSSRAQGGRGVGNVIESEFLNPLSEYLCEETDPISGILCGIGPDGRVKFRKEA